MTIKGRIFFIFSLLLLTASLGIAKEADTSLPSESLLRDMFVLNHNAKVERDVYEVEGFVLVYHPAPDWNSSYSIVTGFKGDVLTTHILKNVNSVEDARKYFLKHVKSHHVSGVNIRELYLEAKTGPGVKLFWIGNRAFRTLKDAQKSVAVLKKNIEAQGGSFKKALNKMREVSKEPPPPPKPGKPARAELEEKYAFKALDWLGFTEYLYGPFYSEPSGEKILYQSTFETTYRTTNFSKKDFNALTGYWSHRIVLRGIRFIGGTTVDPYIEAVPSWQSDPSDFATNLEVSAGLEWRPLIRNAFLQNYQPYGLPVLDWIRNTRVFLVYSQRKNLKDKFDDDVITNNLRAGVELFKEWGVELPSLDVMTGENPYFKKSDLLWGEMFLQYFYNKTNFSGEPDYQSIQNTEALKIGIKLPRFPLPDNPINQEFLLMPYFVFENNVNHEHDFFFQNRFYYGYGLRWMPFRDYRFANNEWLFKTKVFFEYYPEIHYGQAKPVSETPEQDIRFGLNMSLKRF